MRNCVPDYSLTHSRQPNPTQPNCRPLADPTRPDPTTAAADTDSRQQTELSRSRFHKHPVSLSIYFSPPSLQLGFTSFIYFIFRGKSNLYSWHFCLPTIGGFPRPSPLSILCYARLEIFYYHTVNKIYVRKCKPAFLLFLLLKIVKLNPEKL